MADYIFCKIIKGEIPSSKVFGSEKIVAFNDINPKAKVHILIVPKKYIKIRMRSLTTSIPPCAFDA